ncbi:hypothetical protein H4I96_05418 [Botrytis cinerea]
MAGNVSKKRKVEDGMKGKTGRPSKKFKKQTYYESSSDEEESATTQDFQAVNLQDSDEEEGGPNDAITGSLSDEDDEPDLNAADNELEEEVTDASNSDSENSDDGSDTNSNPNLIKARKRNDPEAFATSMSKILGSKLSASKRSDPVLSRSQTAIEASKEMTDLALEKKAKHKMREEKRLQWKREDNGYGNGENVPSVQATMELEKRLRKTAQRGVVKLFNAVRAAQVKGEEAAKEARQKGVVGQGRREEKINEMSKKGFLDLIAGGGGLRKGEIEEA